MKKELKSTIILLLATIFISACGGGGSPASDNNITDKPKPVTTQKQIGYYIDSAIIGATYDCETTSGTTDSKGKFEFENGHDCKFYLSKKLLRSVDKSKLFNGIYILEDNNKTASVLQTMDLDGNASNGVQILPEATQCLNDSLDDINVSALKNCLDSNVTSYSGHEVNITEATKHIEQTILENKPTANEDNITVTEDTAQVITLTGSDPQGDSLIYTVTEEPAHGTLSGSGANVTYMPNLNYTGSDSFKFKVSDGTFESNETTINITVNPINDLPTAVNDITTVDEDANVLIDVLSNDSDTENDILTISTVSNPSHGNTTIENGKVKYTPNLNYNGSDSFTYTVRDGNGGTATATVNITVNPVNDTPTAIEQNVSTDEDNNKSITLAGNDIDGDTLSYTVTEQPTNGTLSGTAPNLIYLPNANFNGSDSFKFKVNDGTVDSVEAVVNITVNPVNDAPTAVNDTATVDEDNNALIDVLANDNDIDGDTLTISTVSNPYNGVAVIENGKVKYTPDANYNGDDNLTYTISDGNGATATATVNITVNPVNDVPVANDDNLTTDEDTALNGNLSVNDIASPDGGNVWSKKSDPAHGVVSVTSDGTFTYTPAENYNGSDNFEYKITDADGSVDTATVNITVNPVNDTPTAIEQNVSTDEDNNKSITLAGNDIDGDTLSYTVTEQPTNGTLSGTAPNLIYLPNANFNGSDSFKFKVNDGTVDSTEATILITITAVNDAPVALDSNISTNENTSKELTLSATDIDSSTLSYSVTQNPANGSVTLNDNVATYTPNDGYIGSDSFKYKVNDGSLDSNEATISIEIIPVNLHITEDYKVIPLGSNTTISKKIYLDSSAKNLYLVLSNKDDSNTSSATVSHNARVAQTSSRQSLVVSSRQEPAIKYPPKYITDFNTNAKNSFIKNSHRNSNIVASPKTASSVGDTHTFYLSADTSVSTEATLKSIVSNVSTDTGTRTLNVWVSNDSFGSGCEKATCVTQDMVDTLADKFLKSGSDNDIYDWVTSIYGKEWGSDAQAKYSNLIGESDTIDILLTDIDDDNSTNGGVVGYFWSKDNFSASSYPGSNERIMFYADSVMFANTSNGDFWQKELYVTLAHEFQHMINFYQKNIIQSSGSETWLNEMMSVTTEDLLATKLEHDGDRGVDYTDGSAGASGNTHGRFPRFNQNNDITLTNWEQSSDVLNDYAKVASFGAFLVRNYGGAELMHNIMDNNFSDENAVTEAIKTTTGKDVTFVQLLQEWGIAVMLSSRDDLTDTPQYNFGDFLIADYNGISYKMGSINFFNYNPEPTLHTTVSKVNPHANYYYKIGENITSNSVDLNVTLDANTYATLIAK